MAQELPKNHHEAGSSEQLPFVPTNYAKDILGNLSKGMQLAWCTMRPPPHFSKCSAASEEAPSLKAKILEALVVYKNYVAKLEFLGRRGGGMLNKKRSVGGVWIFLEVSILT